LNYLQIKGLVYSPDCTRVWQAMVQCVWIHGRRHRSITQW